MSTVQTLADDVKAQGRFFRSVIELADYLEGIGSIEQATTEATAVRDKALADRDAALASALAAAGQLATAQDALLVAGEDAAEVLAEATAQAQAALDAASAQASAIVGAANQRAADIDAHTADRQSVLDGLQVSVTAKRLELSDLEGKVAAIKAQVATLIQ